MNMKKAKKNYNGSTKAVFNMKIDVFNLLAVGMGGFIGSCLRFALTRWLSKFTYLPFGTLASNVIAALVIGLIIGIERQSSLLPVNQKLFMTVGFLGGLSTFSAFSLETVILLERGSYYHAAGNILLNVCLCLFFVLVGLQLAKLLVISDMQ